MQLLFDAPRSSSETTGLGLIARHRDAASGRWAAGSRTSAGTRSRFERPSPLTRRACPRPAVPFYHVHSLVVRARRRRRRGRHDHATARRSRRSSQRGIVSTACSFTPRNRLDTGCGCSRASPACAARPPRRPRRSRRCAHDPPARDRHPRGQGGSAGARGLRPAHRVRRRPAGAPRSAGWRRAPARCTWSTSTAPAAATRSNLEHVRRIVARGRGAGPGRRRPARPSMR